MDISQQKEQFSNAYLQAVVSVAGYTLYKPAVDDDSVDWGIAAKGGIGKIRSPRLELQLKSTSREVLGAQEIRYPLKLKNYEDLRCDEFAIPRILVVLLLPDSPANWIQQSEEALCLRYCSYWVSLRGLPETANTTAVTVAFSRTSLFTPMALQSIMELISQGQKP